MPELTCRPALPRCSRRHPWASVAVFALSLAGCGGGSGGATPLDPGPAPTVQEQQCQARGWVREVILVQGQSRLVLWKAAPGPWTRGALVVLHGGGGSHTNYCVANVESIAAQVRFTDQALARGFAVFLLDSSDQITDHENRLCGKVWDDEVRTRANLDLPFVGELLALVIPARRPAGSRAEVFVTGHSSGGYMTVRLASHFADRISAFAPVASGDPYGWYRDCTRRAGDRPNVFGAGFDAETRRQIIEPDACRASAYPNERPWDGGSIAVKPPFKIFHHAQDGINDRSCVDKIRLQLAARGFPQEAAFTLDGGPRSAEAHAWQDAYNAPLLDFFESQARQAASSNPRLRSSGVTVAARPLKAW